MSDPSTAPSTMLAYAQTQEETLMRLEIMNLYVEPPSL
jgi:hypothetical protein